MAKQEKVTNRQRESYDLVNNYRKQNPGASQEQAFKATGVVSGTYHLAKQRIEAAVSGPKPTKVIRRPYKKKAATMEVLPVPEVTNEKPIAVMFIAPSVIGDVMKNFIGG